MSSHPESWEASLIYRHTRHERDQDALCYEVRPGWGCGEVRDGENTIETVTKDFCDTQLILS